MTIHVTPIPRLIDLAAPSFTLGTANAAGSAVTAVASDSTLLVFDAVAVDAITLGQSGSVGTATVAPRRDHAHAMESVTAASSAEMEAATSNTVFATPGVAKFAPGVAKAWASLNDYGALGSPDYNVASITDSGTGDWTVVLTVDFSTSVWAQASQQNGRTSDEVRIVMPDNTRTVGGIDIDIYDSDGARADQAVAFAFYGDQ